MKKYAKWALVTHVCVWADKSAKLEKFCESADKHGNCFRPILG